MKILLINTVCGIRSTGRIVTDLADKYMAEGHECRIAYGREAVPSAYQSISYRIGSQLDVRINALKARLRDNEGFNAKKETARFIEWADNYDPDVLWLHNLHGYYINIELLFDWIKKRPQMEVRWTLHDSWPFTGHCAYFSSIKCVKWQSGCHACPQKKEYPTSWLVDNCQKNYIRKKQDFCGVERMTIVTPSHWLAGIVRQSFLKDYPVEVVHNTIDGHTFRPTEGNFRQKHGLEGKTIILGVASAWGDRKGLTDFIELSRRLDDSYSVVLVGLTAKQIKKMPKHILCIERTNSKRELAEIYTAADVFLNLTYEDNYPTVNLESQACGTPCITYRTGGSVESVPPSCVIEQGDLDALLVKLNEMKANMK